MPHEGTEREHGQELAERGAPPTEKPAAEEGRVDHENNDATNPDPNISF